MLAARSPELAARLLHRELGAVLSCVSRQRFVILPRSAGGVTFDIQLPDGARLRSAAGGPSFLALDAAFLIESFEHVGQSPRRRWQASLRMYVLAMHDALQRELLVYHWMPGPLFLGPDHPHLHVSAALTAQADALTPREIRLDKLHLPTGQVALAAFVRMLITEFDIAPLRSDWRDILDRAEADMLG